MKYSTEPTIFHRFHLSYSKEGLIREVAKHGATAVLSGDVGKLPKAAAIARIREECADYIVIGDCDNETPEGRCGGHAYHQHHLKSWPDQFASVLNGSKVHEVRVFDRDFKLRDSVVLHEYRPVTKVFTGRWYEVTIADITWPGSFSLPANIGVFSFRKRREGSNKEKDNVEEGNNSGGNQQVGA